MPKDQMTPAPTGLNSLLRPPKLYGAVALVLLGIASFFFVTTYLQNEAPPVPSETAAAAAPAIDAFDGIWIEGKSAIVYDMKTGKTLYEKDADAQLPLASITKVMLTLAVTESMPLDTIITIPYDTAPAGSAKRLGKGERWKLQDVINFTLVNSSNEGADILSQAANDAIHARFPDSPAVGATIWRMNELAKELGLSQTYFLNDNGLDISSTQSGAYASARDVSRLMIYAASTSPLVFSGTAENGILLSDEDGDKTHAINTNTALGDIPGLLMGKTGYTDLAGGNLAVVFDVGLAHPVVAVVLGSSYEGRFSDMKTLAQKARVAVSYEH